MIPMAIHLMMTIGMRLLNSTRGVAADIAGVAAADGSHDHAVAADDIHDYHCVADNVIIVLLLLLLLLLLCYSYRRSCCCCYR